MKISTLTYSSVAEVLKSGKFHMHYDCSDALREVSNENSFNDVKETIMKKYGDVEVELNPNEKWFDKVQYVDDKWLKAHNEYVSVKSEWCERYGCD